MSDADATRFSELLPFYVNGTLEGDDLAFVERYLREHPRAQAELRFTQLLGDRLRATAIDRVPTAGLDRLLGDFNAARNSGGMRVRFAYWREHWGLSPAFAVAAAVVVVQGGLLIGRETGTPSPWAETRGQSAGPAVGPVLRLSVRPDARFDAVTELLQSLRGSIVSGPDERGELSVQFMEGADLDALQASLRDSGLVDDVVVPVLP